ncbi:hypothetical protein A2U01_0040956, partial [Trifolium medium]|nr:hypothetical protein [Trifolium medium]
GSGIIKLGLEQLHKTRLTFEIPTISPSSVSQSILYVHTPPQTEVFYLYTCTAIVALNMTRRLTTFVKNTFDTRSRSKPLSMGHLGGSSTLSSEQLY